MSRKIIIAAALTLLASVGGHAQLVHAQSDRGGPISEADAAAAADAFQAAWTSMDAAKIEAAYAPDLVSFSPIDAPLASSWGDVQKRVAAFTALKMNKMEVADRRIQILGSDVFVVSGTGRMTSTAGPVKERSVRFTHVYHKQPDGQWKIVTAHRSFPPKEGTAP